MFVLWKEWNFGLGAARRKPEHKSFVDKLAALGRHDNFTLAGIAGRDAAWVFRNGRVHAKPMPIDDAWATIDSRDPHGNSLFGHIEMNASFRAPAVVRSLRRALLAEHLWRDTADL